MGGKYLLLVAFLCVVPIVYTCNEAICASVVSKCMLTKSCNCDLKDCSCCKECYNCLNYLYTECCSCVDMCPKSNDTLSNTLSKTSYVEELTDGVPGLFNALTGEVDLQERWLSITYPVDFNIALYRPVEKQIIYHLQSVEQEPEPINPDIVTFNCTVAYMSQCMSIQKCRMSCRSMGANSLRWFHDGCCECVGDKCMSYGINESRCLACPGGKEGHAFTTETPIDDDLTEDDFDYGEETDPQSI